jgi:COP9 signalosome complex subunit 3
VQLDCGVETLVLLFDCSVVESQATSSSSSGDVPTISLGGLLWEKIRLYMQSFDPIAVRYVGEFWRKLIELVHQSATGAQAVRSPFSPN